MATEHDRTAAIGRRIQARREREGLSHGQLAVYAEVSRSYITRLEAGGFGEVSAEKLRRIARALGCTVDDLMGASEETEGWLPLLLPPEEVGDILPFRRLSEIARKAGLAAGKAIEERFARPDGILPIEQVPHDPHDRGQRDGASEVGDDEPHD